MEQNIPHASQMFHLPIEVSVYVPSTQDVDKVISKSEMNHRINEVKEYLAKLFGGYSSTPIEGGFLASNNQVVSEDVEKVTSFAQKDDFNKHKEDLVVQCSKWADKWGQEAIGLEHEGDLYYVPQKFEHGGNLEPKDAIQMAMIQAERLEHHVSELKSILEKHPKIEAWIIAKLESASTDLENVTHYLGGLESIKGKKMAKGGSLNEETVTVNVKYIEQKTYEKEKEIEIPVSELETYKQTKKLSNGSISELISKINEKNLAEVNIIKTQLEGYELEQGGSISDQQESKVGRVMREFKEGKLHSSSGDLVTDRKQAIAIALSEAGIPKKEQGGNIADYEYLKNKEISKIITKDGREIDSKSILDGAYIKSDSTEPKEETNKPLLAPNGQPTKLTPEQYKLVRSPEFINWFGDWINDPKSASKVVDENGEPMQMYHNTDNDKFTVFSKKKLGNSSGWETAYLGFYFGNKYEEGSYGSKTIKCFLNIRSPFLIKTDYYTDFDYEYKQKSEMLLASNFFKKNNYDGILIDIEKLQHGELMDKVFVAFEPNQIKLSDGRNTTFDPTDKDIRFEKGGSVSDQQESKIGKVMREFKEGKLHSSSGDLVTDRKQAIAIALSEAGIPKKEQGGNVNGKVDNYPIDLKIGDYVYYEKWFYEPIYRIEGKVIDIYKEKYLTPNLEPIYKVKIEIIEKYDFKMNTKVKHQKTAVYDYKNISKLNKFVKGGNISETLLAPNGQPTKLTPEQYKLVRSPEFINWFGDWINDPQNASKVVDENGEPLVCYHGSDNKFNTFDIKKASPDGFHGKGFYFATSDLDYGNNLYACFLNFRKPFDINADYSKDEIKAILKDRYSQIETLIDEEALISYNGLEAGYVFYSFAGNNALREAGFDGLIHSNIRVAFEPNQIKLANGKNTTFDPNNDDIRFEKGGDLVTDRKQANAIALSEAGIPKKEQGGNIADYEYLKNKEISKIITKDGREIDSKSILDGAYIKSDSTEPKEETNKPLLAPNGQPTKLTPEQYKLVRSPEFINWFGDWINDPQNASKVVDANGEPLVLYHGSINNFNKFRTKSQYIKYKDSNGKNQKFFWSSDGSLGDGAYFTPDKDFAMQYTGGGYGEMGNGILYEVFLNLKNPASGKIIENSNYDGAIGIGAESDIYLAKYPSQIKLADGTNTTFDPNNDDIRFEKGGDLVTDRKQANAIALSEAGIPKKEQGGNIADYEYLKNKEISKIITKDGREIDSKSILDGAYIKSDSTEPKEETNKPLLAPNGQPTKLTPKQYKLVRSPEFINWFGDWINDPQNASKVVDENGEPLLVYHGTNYDFTTFELDTAGKRFNEQQGFISDNADYGMWGVGFYFSPIKKVSKSYGLKLMKLFLNIRNPFVRNPNLNGSNTEFKPVFGKEGSLSLREAILSKNYDGVIHIESSQKVIAPIMQIVAYHPNQIKLADGTNTTFDSNNDDIRFEKGGDLDSKTPAPIEERIKGSKFNEAGSSKDLESAEEIKFDDDTLTAITNKVMEHNKEFPNKKITLASAKAVVRRGMGAYSSSHRPTITDGKPNSRVAWGLARLNAFIYKVQNGKSESGKYVQDDDLIEELGIRFENGGNLESEGWNNDYESDPIYRGLKKGKEYVKLGARAGMAYLTKGKSEMGNMEIPQQFNTQFPMQNK